MKHDARRRFPPAWRLAICLASVLAARCARADSAPPGAPEPAGGALAGERFRVIVSTDIGGSDPDDFQSMVHYLIYADLFDTEGLVSSPPGAGRKAHILEALDAYAMDYPLLRKRSGRYPTPDALRAATRQGAVDPAPAAGFSGPTEGSRQIIERARAADPRPLWILVWGSITDVAQALHDAPEIAPKLRVYSIGSWNTRMDPHARDYVVKHHPDLWLIEADTTFRGMYVGGAQAGDLGNAAFIERHVRGRGALGELFFAKKQDIKMGDTPSVLYLFRGCAEDPAGDHWGGAFVRRGTGPNHWTDNPEPSLQEKDFPGARTVSRWREAYLHDLRRRMDGLGRDSHSEQGALPRLRVSDNRRFLVTADGKPFFWLADTAWELIHRLDREEIDSYLANRAQNGFTVIQVVALAELDGLAAPNAYGHRPLCKVNGTWDPARPDVKAGPANDYWDHVDWVIDRAAENGLYVALLPTWGDKVEKKWGAGPVIFNADNAREYGRWIGMRYRDRPNLIWMAGGDRPAHGPHIPVWNALAEAIDKTAPQHLITFHFASSEWAHDKPWLDFNTIASGHSRRDNPAIYEEISKDYAATPPKPVLDSEPPYESHPVNWHRDGATGWFDDFDVRKAAYWSVFAGACGFTYGCHDVWQMHTPGRAPVSKSRFSWQDALDFPGAHQMRHLRRLMESRPFLTRIPDQSVIAGDAGEGADHVRATRDANGTCAMVYSPSGKPFKVRMDKIDGDKILASWFNPRTGEATAIGEFPNSGESEFAPPTGGENHDWVLVLDGAAKKLPPPGKPL